MGVESFFLNAKVSREKLKSDVVDCLINAGFHVSEHTRMLGGIWKKKIVLDNEFVINNLIICSLDIDSNICLQACFSCYEKAMGMMIDVLLVLKKCKYIDQITHGADTLMLCDLSAKEIAPVISDWHSERYLYFQSNYTRKEIELLPDDFYSYYRKHRKELT